MVVGGVGVGAAVWGYVARVELPRHGGKDLDGWLEEINRAGSNVKLTPVDKALEAMGTNCLPYVLERMVAVDPAWKKKLAAVWSRQRLVPAPFRMAEERRDAAFMAMMGLRGEAGSILPRVNELRNSAPSQWMWIRGMIPEKREEDFVAGCASTNARVRSVSAWGLARGGRLSYTTGWGAGTFWTNQVFRFAFTFGSEDIDQMANNLGHTNSDVRRASAEAIGDHVGLAKGALPALRQALKDEAEIVRTAAAGSIREIEKYHQGQP